MELAKVHQAANTLDTVLTAWRGMKDLAEAAQVVVQAYNEVHLAQQAKEKAETEKARLLEDIKKLADQKETLEHQTVLQAAQHKEMLDKALVETQEQIATLRSSVDAVRMEVDRKVKDVEAEANARIVDAKVRAEAEVRKATERIQSAKAEAAVWENKLTGAMRGYEDFKLRVLGDR